MRAGSSLPFPSMTSDPNSPRGKSLFRPLPRIIFGLLILLLLNWGGASWMLWHRYDSLTSHLAQGRWPDLSEGRILHVENTGDGKVKTGHFLIARYGPQVAVEMDIPGQELSPLRLWASEDSLQLASLPRQQAFQAAHPDYSPLVEALRELGGQLPKADIGKRLLMSVALHPLVTGVRWGEGGLLWKIRTSKGSLWLNADAVPVEGGIAINKMRVRFAPAPKEEPPLPGFAAVTVPAEELVGGIAEGVRILGALAGFTTYSRAEGLRKSGAGWMVVQGGRAQMHLQGSSYEIGHQHGSLVSDEVRRLSHRLVYGVGLLYSLKKGEWFPAAARKLVERQRPFIASAYFEEMRGIADGSGVPLDLIQAANIFPEFFHCSGVALMGAATVGGELLHARVLDYMVGVGLQDHATVMAVSRPGVNRFVTVGYVAFIGSVTGMNEKQVAIGEMGGRGEGAWDGIPMSLLIRQSLETCDTLEDVERLMRESPRTCEYYYLISDGKGPSALGIAATPNTFETFGPGEWHERLSQPIKDAVLISGSGRYEKLVERVQGAFGKISPDNLIEIIKRPVAMKSNLHNVIFQPQSLRLSVADASNKAPACDQPYQTYSWDALFSAAPSL